jgi:two-component system chemotaxis response regulator CheB
VGGRDIVVIGASAGGVSALLDIAERLPHGLPASLFVVIHSSPDSPGLLPHLLTRIGPLPASHGTNGERFHRGRIYVAPPDRHMTLNERSIHVTRGPRENGFRPAVDPLFRTAAEGHGGRVIGVVLSGGLNDGTHGLRAIKKHGGVAVVQNVNEAIVPSMPASAIANVDVDDEVNVRELPALLARLVGHPGREGKDAMTRTAGGRTETRRQGPHALQKHPPDGELSAFTCPACGGALWEARDGKLVRFACHVGHGYTAETLMKSQDDGIETALWSALRALEEKAALRRRMADHARRGRMAIIASKYEEHAEESERQAEKLRAVLVNGNDRPEGPERDGAREPPGERATPSKGRQARRAAARSAR